MAAFYRATARRYIMLHLPHGVPTPMYFRGVLTDGGGADKFTSATSRGDRKN